MIDQLDLFGKMSYDGTANQMRSKRPPPPAITSKSDASRNHVVAPLSPMDSPVALGIYHIESLLERISHGKLKKFDATHLEQLRKLSAIEITNVNARCRTTLDGMNRAISGDEFDIESYSNFSPSQLELAVEYLKFLHSLKHNETANGKIRLPTTRLKKPTPAKTVVKHLLYLPSDKETGLASERPEDLVGAAEMWIYNTKTRKLGVYFANDPEGLTAKGTKILNYNLEASRIKLLRKPAIQLKAFMACGIVGKRKFWKEIKAAPQHVPPRLNRETLILKTHNP